MRGLFSSVYCIDSGPGPGRFNMDFDMRLMHSFVDGSFQKAFGSGSCLWRFYSWAPPAVSLGRNQDPAEIDADRCRADGIDIVVRPTGGRAVFHADELTYSFFAETPVSNEVIYRMVHEAIADALGQVGVIADFCRSQPDFKARYASAEAVPCFTASARYELQVDGRKIVGSAQRRRGDVLLQHGSMPLSGRHRQILRYIVDAAPGLLDTIAADMERKTSSLDEFTGAGYDQLVPLIMAAAGAFSGTGHKLLVPGDLEKLEGFHESIH
ncbi:MAG: lipoate--protein ligase family protein [Chlorobiaceae bacterium]|nr:lipoate--protein ligase family protein [Chlorobiaceae bacterium]